MHIAHWSCIDHKGTCKNLWELQLIVLLHLLKLLSPSMLPTQPPPLPSFISWPVYSECKYVHYVTAVILYCICLLKCGVKWILISEHRLIVHNQLCARAALCQPVLSGELESQLRAAPPCTTWCPLPILWVTADLNDVTPSQIILQPQEMQNSWVFLFTLCFICC